MSLISCVSLNKSCVRAQRRSGERARRVALTARCVNGSNCRDQKAVSDSLAPLVDRRALLAASAATATAVIAPDQSKAAEYPTAAVDRVKGIYELFKAGDIPAVIDACSPKIKWSSTWNGTPFAVKGKEGVGYFFQALNETLDVNKFQPIKYGADDDGDEVFVLIQIGAVARRTGKPYVATETNVWTFDADGKVLVFKSFADTKALYDADPTPPPSK